MSKKLTDLRKVYIDKVTGEKRLLTDAAFKYMLPDDKSRLIKQDTKIVIPNEFKDKSNQPENGQGTSNGQRVGRKSKSVVQDTEADNQA